MIVFQIAKSADWCLGPYVYEFFQGYHHLTFEMTARMIGISFLANLFLGPLLVGYLNDKSDKKFPCLLYGIMLALSCSIRQIKHPLALIMSQICFGISSSVLYTSFENWFVSETNNKIKCPQVKDLIISSAFEKSMIGDSFTAVGVSVITGQLKSRYGIQAPYMFSIGLAMTCFFVSSFILTGIDVKEAEENKHEVEDVFKNIKESLVVCKNNKFIILIGVTESLLFAVLHIFIFSWNPTLIKMNENLDTGDVFTMFMMALMLGGASFRVRFLFIYHIILFYIISLGDLFVFG